MQSPNGTFGFSSSQVSTWIWCQYEYVCFPQLSGLNEHTLGKIEKAQTITISMTGHKIYSDAFSIFQQKL